MTPSIRSLYAFALAEGEGVGTAYEYYVKRRVLRSVLAHTPAGGALLVAGLPEKYGTSLDFVLAAAERRARVLVVDDRDEALSRARAAFGAMDAAMSASTIEYKKLGAMREVGALSGADVALSCEVMQRLAPDERRAYAGALLACAPRGAVFAPNGENESHTKISGLRGLTLPELRALVPVATESGYVDMPPFPPGITRSAAQRARASSGLAEAVAMWGLQAYALAEPYAPRAIKRRVAHIVYAKWDR